MPVKIVASLYSLHKLKRFFHQAMRRYKRKAKKLDLASKEKIESQLATLKTAIIQKEIPIASRTVNQITDTLEKIIPKSFSEKCFDSILSISIALLIAVVIRTMWFEPYTIPSGSMRPTLKEGDFLVVSKTDYGINVPLQPAHFYFDPMHVKRGGITVFTTDNIDIADPTTTYFYLFPAKKLLVKRLIGKPGDTFYFYGGKLYGIDRQGKDLAYLREDPWTKGLEHIPFIRFDGKVETSHLKQGIFHESTFYQMNKPVAKLSTSAIGTVMGEMLSERGTTPLSQYSDLWGFKNYAMARLLSQEELDQFYPNRDVEKGALYLELAHHPSIQNGQMIRDTQNRLRPDLGHSISILPLSSTQVDTLAKNLTTCRFIVKDGVAYRFGMNVKNPTEIPYLPKLSGIPDGTYEIEKGKAYEVLWGATLKELSKDHPLYHLDTAKVQLLYNLGIEFVTYYNPSKNTRAYPSRYAYFRNNDLYLCGAPIVKKDDSNLIVFLNKEYQKQSMSTSVRPYAPFEDVGPPISSDGKIDVNFIRKYGLQVPEKMYLVLGDNHAMSADSRDFGFVPENNLRGGPSVLVWPPGPRLGRLPQAPFSHFTFPIFFIWTSAITITIISTIYTRRRFNKAHFPHLDQK